MSFRHFKSLLFKSAQIQQEIEREHQRRWPDWMRLLKLKKLRLAIKDRMERIVHDGASGRLQSVRAQSGRVRNGDWRSA